jgi:hypothetical protein
MDFIKYIFKLTALLKGKTLLTIDYLEGYNFHFRISKEDAESLLPPNLKPLKLKILKNDTQPDYYLTWYLASMDSDTTQSQDIKRIDLFTYAIDQNDEYALFFVSSIMQIPDFIMKKKSRRKMYLRIMDYFARDSRTNKPSYPHYLTDKISAKPDSFLCQYNDSHIASEKIILLPGIAQFDDIFVLANSQIYRNDIDKNVNYFNQRFVCAPVKQIDLSCISLKNLTGFHPLCKNLVAAQIYGSKEKPSRWYFEI